MKRENAASATSLTLVLIGALLAVADDIKNIPALAPYSNWSTAIIALAVAVKQILSFKPPENR
jgi:uncharacterized membrane protein YjfL (UPF0719 family)